MRKRIAVLSVILLILVITVVRAQNSTTTYTVGEFQTANPNYPHPNPFYFEGKVDWNLLNISQPSNAWEYMEEGMHAQDDLGDIAGATQDYQTALSMNSLQNGTCQIVTAANLVNGALPATLTPPPCIFTLRLRLGSLLQESNPTEAISLFQEVLSIDPLRLGVNKLIGETYMIEAGHTTDPTAQQQAYQNAIQALQAELALSPVTAQTIALTADQANNAHVWWDLAQIYQALGQNANAANAYQQYLLATQWHSDVYPWRIALAQQNIKILQARLRHGQ
jgi:tetratricopeptide (TPR) repeat protein